MKRACLKQFTLGVSELLFVPSYLNGCWEDRGTPYCLPQANATPAQLSQQLQASTAPAMQGTEPLAA